jgi:hypothetical protein
LLAAGAIGIPRRRFLVVFGAARTLRYSLITWLALVYGRRVVRLWSGTLAKWETTLIWAFVALMVGGVSFGIWKLRSRGNPEPAEDQAIESAPARAH